jgi:hypothetical protein
VRGGCRELAGRGSIATTHSLTGRCSAARAFETRVAPTAARESMKLFEEQIEKEEK